MRASTRPVLSSSASSFALGLALALAALAGVVSSCASRSGGPVAPAAQASAIDGAPPGPPPSQPATSAVALAGPNAPGGAGSPSAAFAAVRDRVLDELLADDPSTARDLGLHEYDGKVAPISAEAIAARVSRLARATDDLASVAPGSLTPDEALDCAELQSWVASSLFSIVDMAAPRKSPSFYESLFALSDYIDRDYAPLDAARRAPGRPRRGGARRDPPRSREPVAAALPAGGRGRGAQLRGLRDLPPGRRGEARRPRGRRRAEAAVREGQRGAREGGRRPVRVAQEGGRARRREPCPRAGAVREAAPRAGGAAPCRSRSSSA